MTAMTPASAPAGHMVYQVNREVVVLLGWGRAILLQLAHPLVAAAVSQHSDFGAGLIPYLRRTHQTVSSMLSLTFGTNDQVHATARRINAIHRRVHGRSVEATPGFPSGTPYTATDSELLRWVHVTLIDSQIRAYELFVGPVSAEEKDRYCSESANLAPLLNVPPLTLPTSNLELTGQLQHGIRDGTSQVTNTARSLAHDLLFPPGGVLASSAMGFGRLVTAGLLPPPLREAYGLAWSDRKASILDRSARMIRRARRLTPPLLRQWPASRRRQVERAHCPLSGRHISVK